MKKFLAFFASFMIVAVLALTVMSFTDDHPKKHKCENTAAASDTTKTCSKHTDDATADTKKCCKEAGNTASSDCKKSETCEHHKKTADASKTENK